MLVFNDLKRLIQYNENLIQYLFLILLIKLKY